MYEIDIDRESRIITLRMIDWMDPKEAKACGPAKEQAVIALGPPYADHRCIVDITEFRIHPQETIDLFTKFVMNTKYKAERVAVVAGQGSAKMQFRRIVEKEIDLPHVRMFDSTEAATNWLREPVQQAA